MRYENKMRSIWPRRPLGLPLVFGIWPLLFFDWGSVESFRANFYLGPWICFWDQLAIVRIKRPYENFGSVAPWLWRWLCFLRLPCITSYSELSAFCLVLANRIGSISHISFASKIQVALIRLCQLLWGMARPCRVWAIIGFGLRPRCVSSVRAWGRSPIEI